jgi:fatty-acyl-CoA synthase
MAEATLAISFIGLEERLRTDRIDANRYCSEQRAVPVRNGTAALEVVSCGRPFPEHQIAILDEGGVALPERKIGEICLRGPSVAAGYFGNLEASRAAGMVEGGWLRTGDLGYLAAGELYVSGRLKDLLIINGRNFYPQRIEWAVEQIAGVRKGSPVVFSRPGPASEEVVVVVETRHPEPARLQAEIIARVSDDLQLAVADVVLVEPGSLPKTSSGKQQRRKTRELYLTGKLTARGTRRMIAANSKVRVAKLLAYSLVGRARHQARGWFRRFLPPPV